MKKEIIAELIGAFALIIAAIIGLFNLNEAKNNATIKDSFNNSPNSSFQQGDIFIENNIEKEENNNYVNIQNITYFMLNTETDSENAKIALEFDTKGNTKEAEAYYKSAIQEMTDNVGESNNDVARLKNNLGVMYAKNGEFGLASNYLNEAKIILTLNEQFSDVLQIECNEANILISKNNSKEAVKVYTFALKKALIFWSSDSQIIQNIKQNLENIQKYMEEMGIYTEIDGEIFSEYTLLFYYYIIENYSTNNDFLDAEVIEVKESTPIFLIAMKDNIQVFEYIENEFKESYKYIVDNRDGYINEFFVTKNNNNFLLIRDVVEPHMMNTYLDIDLKDSEKNRFIVYSKDFTHAYLSQPDGSSNLYEAIGEELSEAISYVQTNLKLEPITTFGLKYNGSTSDRVIEYTYGQRLKNYF